MNLFNLLIQSGRSLFFNITGGNANAWFAINPYSGLITTMSLLDREEAETVSLTVTANDGGVRSMTATTRLVINLVDTNDNAPVFAASVFRISISESATPNVTFFTVNASDADQGENGKITYRLAHLGHIFSVDEDSGELATKVLLDRETRDRYDLTVVAEDRGNPRRTSTATIRIELEDANDNVPKFYPSLYFVALPTKRTALPVLTLQASDDDLGENAKLKFLLEGSGHPHVRLNEDTGNVVIVTKY